MVLHKFISFNLIFKKNCLKLLNKQENYFLSALGDWSTFGLLCWIEQRWNNFCVAPLKKSVMPTNKVTILYLEAKILVRWYEVLGDQQRQSYK